MSEIDFRTIIRRRREGERQIRPEFDELCRVAADGSVPDYQLAAWLMAAYLRPLSDEETADLTLAMAESGERLDLTGVPKPWVDKHSTGGIGDKTTVALLPILAACGLSVTKMSGRGLGITGGTIDKLGSVPGFRTDLSPTEMVEQAKRIGIALTGQTPDLAPADKALYALRDVTETVDSLPLIVSSILSKKIAGGAEVVVLDVKCGSGSFNPTPEKAKRLASALKSVGEYAGLRVRASITDMDQVLGSACGNALEIREALDILRDQKRIRTGPAQRFKELVIYFAGLALHAAGMAETEEDGRAQAQGAITTGWAWKKAKDWFTAQGCESPLEEYELFLPTANERHPVLAPTGGYVHGLDARLIGEAVLHLGGGRITKADELDLSVGIEIHREVGDKVDAEEAIATVHARNLSEAREAERRVLEALTLRQEPCGKRQVILFPDEG